MLNRPNLKAAFLLFTLILALSSISLSQSPDRVVIGGDGDESQSDSVQKELKDCPYLPGIKGYIVGDADDKEMGDYKFFDGSSQVTVEGRRWKKMYKWDGKSKMLGDIEIALFYNNLVEKMSGKLLFYNICENPNCGDRFGFKVLTALATVKKQEIWIEVSPFNDGFDYDVIVVEKFGN